MSTNSNEKAARKGGLRACLAGAAVAVLSLALPAIAAAHPAVYEVERKALTEAEAATCNYGTAPAGTGECLDSIPGPLRYVVVNHNIPVAYDETNGLDASDGGVINFARFPSAFRKTITSSAEWLTVVPPRTGVQPHATCDSTATSNPANIVGWQGTEPFFAYIPWQGTAAGIDDDPADWIGYVKTLTGVDLTGMDAATAEAACEGLPGATSSSYHPADTPLATSIAKTLVEHEVEHAVTPLETEIDGLLGEKSSLQAQIDAWKAQNGTLDGEKAALVAERNALAAQLQTANAAKAKKDRKIKSLRRQLSTLRGHMH